MQPRPILLALVTVLLALGAAGCGEKEEPPTTGPVVAQTTTGPTTTTNGGNQRQQATDAELIRATVTGFLTKPSPSVCDDLITPRFLKQSYGNRQGCVASRKPNALADRVAIIAKKAGPGGAVVVTAKPQGGVFAGQTLKVTVVRSANAWRIDAISGDAKVGP